MGRKTLFVAKEGERCRRAEPGTRTLIVRLGDMEAIIVLSTRRLGGKLRDWGQGQGREAGVGWGVDPLVPVNQLERNRRQWRVLAHATRATVTKEAAVVRLRIQLQRAVVATELLRTWEGTICLTVNYPTEPI